MTIATHRVPMPIDKAKEQYKQFLDQLKKQKTQYLTDMKNATFQLSKGRELIDLYKTFQAVSLEDDMPKLAIVRADAEKCYFEKRQNGAGCFWHREFWKQGKAGKIAMPSKTYDFSSMPDSELNRRSHRSSTIPPTIPIAVYPEHGLKNYYILWEIERGGWLPDPRPPVDPILMKRVTNNLFVPLAVWDLTPLESSILSGLNAPVV